MKGILFWAAAAIIYLPSIPFVLIIFLQLPECNKQGKIIACLLEHRENLTTASCKHMMTKMQAIFFSNYLLIENFLQDCSADVERLTCGRLQTERDEEVPLPLDVYNSGLHNNEIHTPYNKCKFSFSSKAKVSCLKELKGWIHNSKQYIYKPSKEITS